MSKPKPLRFNNVIVLFTHKNERLEKHGPNEKVTGVDLKFRFDTENKVLDMFDPELLVSFYKQPASDEQDLANKAKGDELVRLRHASLATEQKWIKEYSNYDLTFHYGVDGQSDLVLEDCTLKDFSIELHDGGTVTLTWKAGAHPTDEQMGRLSERLRTGSVEISLVKRKVVQKQKDLLDNAPEKNPVERRAANDDPADPPAAPLTRKGEP